MRHFNDSVILAGDVLHKYKAKLRVSKEVDFYKGWSHLGEDLLSTCLSQLVCSDILNSCLQAKYASRRRHRLFDAVLPVDL